MRLLLAVTLGVATAVLMPKGPGWAVRSVAGWDVSSLTLLIISWVIIGRADHVETKRRAGAEDPGRHVVWLLVLMSCLISLFASAGVLRRAKALEPAWGELLAVLCLVAVATAWALTHTVYTLHYAHLYYRDVAKEGGLQFPTPDAPPDDRDFAYFSFTIGMCFQTSDVTITERRFRRSVLVHAVISFAYNSVVLALALNLFFGLFG
jgi:uncharacterized membrane protein